MRDFTDKALILFPNLESYETEMEQYRVQLKVALDNLLWYFDSVDITPYAFYTDDFARIECAGKLKLIQTLHPGERFFARHNIEFMQDALLVTEMYDEKLYNKLNSKDMSDPEMSKEQRFDLLEVHDKRMMKEIIKQFDVVVKFCTQGRSRYTLANKNNKPGKILLEVKPGSFKLEAYMGDTAIAENDLLQVKYASRTLDKWR